MGKSLLEKHSEFLMFNKVFYCDMAKRGPKLWKIKDISQA